MAKSSVTAAAAAVREHPILFSGPMVRAILAGRKTQTRRVVTPQNSRRQAALQSMPYDLERAWRDTSWSDEYGEYLHVPFRYPDGGWDEGMAERWRCKLAVPGDRLWVRESIWLPPEITPVMLREGADTWPDVIYDADERCDPTWNREHGWRLHPSIHMPRCHCRLILEVTEVRVQRLQEISEADAMAEGAERAYPRDRFAILWDTINGKRGYSWSSNPWVWALTFRVVKEQPG